MKALKVQCPHCREISPMERFATSAQGLHFRCGECGETIFIENADNLPDRTQVASGTDPLPAPRPAPPERAAPGLDCPKCGHQQASGDTCHRCGLNFLRFDPANLPPEPEEAASLWRALQDRPADMDLHERFVQTCNRLNRLDYAAKCYRRREGDPAWRDVVEVMRVRLLSLAQAQLTPTALAGEGRDKIKKRSRVFIWVLLLLAMGGFSLLIYYSSDLLNKL